MYQIEENIDYDLLLKFAYDELDANIYEQVDTNLKSNHDWLKIVTSIKDIKTKYNFKSSDEHNNYLFSQNQKLNLRLKAFQKNMNSSDDFQQPKIISLIQKHKYKLAVAASIILILGIFGLSRLQPRHQADLFASHYEKPTFSVQLNTEALDQVQSAYQANDYEKSLMSFKDLIKQNPNNPELQFFMAICFLNQGTTDSAIYYFDQIQAVKESRFSRQASWYKALSYLKANDKKNAFVELKALSQDPGLRPTLKKKVQTLMKGLK